MPMMMTGCGDGMDAALRYDISTAIDSLDPQYAYSEDAKLIIRNVFEGLFVRGDNGDIVPAAAQSYTLSEDKLTVTITLRESLTWSKTGDDEAPALVADDFVFALQRLFTENFPSAFAVDFSCIRNADAILKGELPPSSLGVSELDPQTLVISLEYPEEDLPELLATTAAMPCNRAFFQETRGRYGLSRNELLYNGPFRVYYWEKNELIQLRGNGSYREIASVAPERVTFYVHPAEEHAARFAAGDTDAAVLSYDQWSAQKQKDKLAVQQFEDTVWVLIFNQRYPFLSDINARRALSFSIDHRQYAPNLGHDLMDTSVFLPPTLRLNAESYRKQARFEGPNYYQPDKARRLYSQAVRKARSAGYMDSLVMLVPDNDVHPLTANALQRCWADTLATNISIRLLPQDALVKSVASGDYQAAILPLRPDQQTPGGMLADFKSTSASNIAAYKSGTFDALLEKAAAAYTQENRLSFYMQAEQLLCTDAVLAPLYFQTHYYVMAPGVSGIQFSPFAGETIFRLATKR